MPGALRVARASRSLASRGKPGFPRGPPRWVPQVVTGLAKPAPLGLDQARYCFGYFIGPSRRRGGTLVAANRKAMSAPDEIVLSRDRDLQGRDNDVWIRRGLMALVAVVPILAL